MKRCTGCGEDKPLSHFQIKRRWKRKKDGTVFRYPPAHVSKCHACVYKVDKPRRPKKERPARIGKITGKSYKENILIKAANLKLHPYLKLIN